MDALVVEPSLAGPAKVLGLLLGHNVVGVDEFRFFDYAEDLMNFLLNLGSERLVIVAALKLRLQG